VPMGVPRAIDLWVFLIPGFRKMIECQQRFILGRGLVDFLQVDRHRSVVFPRHELLQ
jgi:hypothetical protein